MTPMRWIKGDWATHGGAGEVLRLAAPLILSNSFYTLQITIDRILLSRSSSEAVAAAMPAAVLFWTPFSLLQNTANYATTFVAQYHGAGRPRRIGPAVWQAFYFSVFAGIAFLGFVPLAAPMMALGSHSPIVQELETTYFRTLCFAAFPMLIVASANSFFAGRGETWTVLLVDAVGLAVNAPLAYAWIFGHWGFPALGIAGAGWATVAGSSVSATLAVALMFRRKYRSVYHTVAGWRFERELFGRLMRFGMPNGLLWMVDSVAFTAFLFLIGRLGDAELAATSIALSINLVAVLPMMGMGQAVGVLVGQRLGQDRPDLAERSTWNGFILASFYMTTVAGLYAFAPQLFVFWFRSEADHAWPMVAVLVPVLLRFVAVYSLFDSMNLIFSFALRGAGDTRFVTIVLVALSWPLLVAPTWASWYYQWGLYWAWGFATVYVVILGLVFLMRFRAGKWKSMRVIEQAPVLEPAIPLPVTVEAYVS